MRLEQLLGRLLGRPHPRLKPHLRLKLHLSPKLHPIPKHSSTPEWEVRESSIFNSVEFRDRPSPDIIMLLVRRFVLYLGSIF
jgi:hypothetical protein